MSPRLLDLFCGAGGAAWGYKLAGFHVTGIDIMPQAHYHGDIFIQGEALAYLTTYGHEFEVIHCSPPCQGYSSITPRERRGHHVKLVRSLRDVLMRLGLPFVIENVRGACEEMRHPLKLCGSMFDLETSCHAQLRRHRYFESNVLLLSPGECQHGQRTLAVHGHEFRNEKSRWAQRRTITVTGSTPQQNVIRNQLRETFPVTEARKAMGIEWMSMRELSQAIPPAYTEWIGHQLMAALLKKEAP